jgi:hypothetical protein
MKSRCKETLRARIRKWDFLLDRKGAFYHGTQLQGWVTTFTHLNVDEDIHRYRRKVIIAAAS